MVLLSLALAAAGYYNPDKVANNSETFKRYADAVQPKAEEMEAGLARASFQIQELDLGVSLLGDRAPTELVAYRDELRKQYAHQGLEAQSFNDWFQEASSSVFMQALDLAVADLSDWQVKECAPKVGGIAGMTGPGGMGALLRRAAVASGSRPQGLSPTAALTRTKPLLTVLECA